MSEPEMYQPRVDKLLQILPPLYAFRMVALELGGVSLAQGSPSEGPPSHVMVYEALTKLNWAIRQPPAVGPSAIDPQLVALVAQFLNEVSTLTGEKIPEKNYTGYPDVREYKAAQLAVADFLSRGFKTDLAKDDSAENHIVVDGYARHLLNLSFKALKKSDDRYTGTENKKRNVVLTYNGHWPLVTDLVAANDYTLIRIQPSDKSGLKFEDFRPAIVELPDDANSIIYINNPNNPKGVMYEENSQKQFLLDVASFDRRQVEAGLSRRARTLSDNAYWGWAKPEYIKENGFPFFTKSAFAVWEETGIRAQEWLMEVFSMGKVFGLASLGASFGYFGDRALQANIQKGLTKDTNTPGMDRLAVITHTLKTADYEHLLYRAAGINENLRSACAALKKAITNENLPIKIDVEPEHGAYITVTIGKELLNRRTVIQRKPYNIRSEIDVCKFLVEKYGVAITPNDQTDLPGTVRIFVDAPKDQLRDGIRRIIAGLKELSKSPPIPLTVGPIVPSQYNT